MQAIKKTESLAIERPSLELLVDMSAPNATATPTLTYATVTRAQQIRVNIDGIDRPAERAKSCLVAPDVGDYVLCAIDGERAYVLAILAGAKDTRVVTEGKLELRADELALGGERVEVESGELGLVAESLRMRAKIATAALEELRLVGRSIEATIADKAALFAERVESRASRFLQRAKVAFRFVEDLEQVRAGNYDVRAESLAAIRGENTIVAARVLAKLDGEQVKIG
jgi:hypothetical protein